MVVIKKERVFVKHTYSDHSNDPAFDGEEEARLQQQGQAIDDVSKTSHKRKGPRGGVLLPFPERLHAMLCDVEQQGLSHVVSWQPHGRCFLIHDRKEFVSNVLPKYFKHKKLTSFQRQLNLYEFARLTTGIDRGGYYHELFLRGRPDVCKRMIRTRVKGHGCRPAASPATEPNFYAMASSSNQEEQGLILPEGEESVVSAEPLVPTQAQQKTKIEGEGSDSCVAGQKERTEDQSQLQITLLSNGNLLHHVIEPVLSVSKENSCVLLQQRTTKKNLFLNMNYIQDDDEQDQGIDTMLKVLNDETNEEPLPQEPSLLQQPSQELEQDRQNSSSRDDDDDQKAVFADFPMEFEDIHHGFFDMELLNLLGLQAGN